MCMSSCWVTHCRLFALVIPNVLILDDWRSAVTSRYTRAVVQDFKHPVENAVCLKFKSWPNPAKKKIKIKKADLSEKSVGVSHHTQTQKCITLKQYDNICLWYIPQGLQAFCSTTNTSLPQHWIKFTVEWCLNFAQWIISVFMMFPHAESFTDMELAPVHVKYGV